MKIKALCSFVGPVGSFAHGREYEVSEEEARGFVKYGLAIIVDEAAPATPEAEPVAAEPVAAVMPEVRKAVTPSPRGKRR